jgi:3-phosphoshikimate 1-carboxyvinyltransferase
MDVTVTPGTLTGTIGAIASKSMAHRLLICAALSSGPTRIRCRTTSADIEATSGALEALGAKVRVTPDGFDVIPIPGTSATDNLRSPAAGALVDCGESGSTLRFLLPVVCALGRGAALTGHGRLAERPLSPLYEELVRKGCTLSPEGSLPLTVSGRLRPGSYELPGDVSSQFVSGLLLAFPLLASPSELRVTGRLESRPYVSLTRAALESFGVIVAEDKESEDETSFAVSPSTPYTSPGACEVEGDWSGSAFWLAAGAMAGHRVGVTGLDLSSAQGDRAILGALARLGARVSRQHTTAAVSFDHLVGSDIDASDIPDLVPPIAAVASVAEGTTTIHGVGRLRLKESDRVSTVCDVMSSLGADVTASADTITIHGVPSLAGGTVDPSNDHRIAMMAAICSVRSSAPVTILHAECVAKSYPGFFQDLAALGGSVTTLGV